MGLMSLVKMLDDVSKGKKVENPLLKKKKKKGTMDIGKKYKPKIRR